MAPVDSSPDAASDAWRRIGELLDRERERVAQVAREFDLSSAQLLALRQLDPEAPQPMGQLACAMACDSSNVTGLINRLEKRGLVERRFDEHDRRVRKLALTAEGIRVRAAVLTRCGTPPECLRSITADELRTFSETLARIAERDDP